ncbi:hypothetical protein [Rhizobium leguminosarum]
MMNLEANVILPAVTVLAVTGFVVGCLRMRAKMHRERAEDLRIAHRALDTFYRSVDKVVGDPAVSDDLKLLLLSMGEALQDRAAARYVVHEILMNGFPTRRNGSDSDSIAEGARALAKSRPDMAEEIVKAFKSGMIAMILRWPETATKFKETSAVLADERAEIAAVKKVTRFAMEHNNSHINGAVAA